MMSTQTTRPRGAAQLRVDVPPDVRLQIKIRAAMQGLTMREWVEDALARKLAEGEAKK